MNSQLKKTLVSSIFLGFATLAFSPQLTVSQSCDGLAGCADRSPVEIENLEGITVSPLNDSSLAILSPGYTRLLSDRPTLSWTPVMGAMSYTVTLYEEGAFVDGELTWDVVGEIETNRTKIAYPQDWGPLKEYVKYYFNVRVSNPNDLDLQEIGVSSKGPERATFQLLAPDSRAVVDFDIDNLDPGLTTTERALAVAQIYEKRQLIADAIALLQATTTTCNLEASALYFELDDLTRQWLRLEIPEYYERGEQLTAGSGDRTVSSPDTEACVSALYQ